MKERREGWKEEERKEMIHLSEIRKLLSYQLELVLLKLKIWVMDLLKIAVIFPYSGCGAGSSVQMMGWPETQQGFRIEEIIMVKGSCGTCSFPPSECIHMAIS